MTGIYPFKLGLQRGFGKHSPEGIPTSIPLLPELLKRAGYATHALGKWHLGFCSSQYTPLKRGFDSFFGLYVGEEEEGKKQGGFFGRNFLKNKDLRGRGKKARQKLTGKRRWKNTKGSSRRFEPFRGSKLRSSIYSSKAMEIIRSSNSTQPFFIYLSPFTKSYPKELGQHKTENENAKNRQIKLEEFDHTVGYVVNALKIFGHYNNTVILFISDNGGREWKDSQLPSPNYPLRGSKGSVYEGGVRVPAFLHSPLLKARGSFTGLLHMVDLLPTILSIARAPHLLPEGLDGMDMWENITNNTTSPRSSFAYNIDDNFVPVVLKGPNTRPLFQMAVRLGRYKLIWGQVRKTT